MNWYVLYVQSLKTEKLIRNLNRKRDIYAFEIKYEYFRRTDNDNDIKPMFKGYVFVKTKMDQLEFNNMLMRMEEERDGMIKQLVKSDTSALRKEEIQMFNLLLDRDNVIKMSEAYIENGKAKVVRGPLQYFEKDIIKVDKHDRVAYLRLSFMGRNIKAGLKLIGKK